MSEEFRTVTREDQVTEEILAIATSVVEGWFEDRRIDIEEFIDRMEMRLDDWSMLDFGNDLDSPAIKMILKHARKIKRELA